ncbi:hypothetical protein COM82_29690 [Bacillus thuringiensis]|uniref:hypothetical protein n=1 Tax=Bacillus thuringiensis TaxID=1428 RepID=UPI000BEBEC99|nr:hypothetical protein [Bacillus thuringiensis]PEB44181.1 hypothetical protein COM82_29690 [Bacillus thuringiensis]
MTNYAEDILTKNENDIYTINIPKNVASIRVSESMPQEFIEGLKKEFPYKAYKITKDDVLRGVTTLHKYPQSNEDWYNYHLEKSEEYEKRMTRFEITNDFKYGTYDHSDAFESLKKQIDKESKSNVEKKTKPTPLERIFFAIVSAGIGATIGYGIGSLIKLFI